MLLGASIGGLAGYTGGVLDDALMRDRSGDAARHVRRPRAARGAAAAPFIARGVRAIVRTERAQDYASAAQALGASDVRLLVRHLLPASRNFVAVEITLLVPRRPRAESRARRQADGCRDVTQPLDALTSL